MRVLGIDCGTARTGYCVIDSDGRTHRFLTAGVIATDVRWPLPTRLLSIATALREVIHNCKPEVAAVEEVFHSVNAKSSLKLAHARGVAFLSVAEAGLPLAEYSPLQIKTSVTGTGRAEKDQVQFMVRELLGRYPELEMEDAADAAAAAICHATRNLNSFAAAAGSPVRLPSRKVEVIR